MPPPGTPPVPSGDNNCTQRSQITGWPARYAYIYTPLPNPQVVNIDAFEMDSEDDEDFIPDVQTKDRTSSG